MATRGVDVVQMRFMGHMGEVMKKCQKGLSVLLILDLKWVTTPRLDSSMACGVGIKP
jgi:hypothetical protein